MPRTPWGTTEVSPRRRIGLLRPFGGQATKERSGRRSARYGRQRRLEGDATTMPLLSKLDQERFNVARSGCLPLKRRHQSADMRLDDDLTQLQRLDLLRLGTAHWRQVFSFHVRSVVIVVADLLKVTALRWQILSFAVFPCDYSHVLAITDVSCKLIGDIV